MRVEKLVSNKNQKLSIFVQDNLALGFNYIQKLLRQKDIKVNGKRVSSDLVINASDEVFVYLPDIINKLDIIYQDDNIVVVFKGRQIETETLGSSNDLLSKVSNELNQKCYAVHRLDRNTEGLVIFAKNEKAKQALDVAFKNRTIDKYYLAYVYGFIVSGTYSAYLKKDSKKSLVYISNEEKPGFEKIITKVKVLRDFEDTSLVEVKLVTGKTHQIRAHLAFLGASIIGDEKYGNSKINKLYKKRFQCLCASRIVFHFEKDSYLYYLNDLTIALDKSKIDFCKNL